MYGKEINMEISIKPLIQYTQDFLDYCEVEKGLSATTARNYRRFLQKFFDWLKKNDLIKLSPSDLTENHIWKYRMWLSRLPNGTRKAASGLHTSTQTRYLIALRALLGYFHEKDIPCLPTEKIKLPKDRRERQVKFLNIEQLETLLTAPDTKTMTGLRDRAMLETLFSTGLRVAELTALERKHLAGSKDKTDFEMSIIGKGNYPRTVYFSERTLYWIHKYLSARGDQDQALFIRFKGPTNDCLRLGVRGVESIVQKYAKLSGISVLATPHTLRHCIHGDTMIFLADKICSAQMLSTEHDAYVHSMDFKTGKVVSREVRQKTRHSTNVLVHIKADGHNLACTPEHRLFTINESGIAEVEAGQLQIGDWIAGVKEVRQKGKRVMNSIRWRLLGYVLGDGIINERFRGIKIYDKNKDFLKFYANIFEQEFSKRPFLRSRSSNSYELIFYSVDVVNWFRRWIPNGLSPTKRVPISLLSATNAEIRQFIAGIYDAEGNLGTIRIFSASPNLLQDIQMLLLRLGITSHILDRIRTVTLPQGKRITRPIYTLHVLNREMQMRFKRLIPTLKENINVDARGEKATHDKLPVQPLVRQVLLAARAPHARGFHEYLARNYHIKYAARYARLAPTRPTVYAFLDAIKYFSVYTPASKPLTNIAKNTNLIWYKVKKIERTKINEEVFDFEVSGTHNLITNGIISHNSFATDLLNNGVDIRMVQEFLGHRHIGTTQVYTHVTSKQLRDIHKKFHGGNKL